MTRPTLRRWYAATLLTAVGLLACDPGAPLASTTDEPMVYLVLSVNPPISAQPGIFTLVANTGTPYALDFRPASRLELRRRRDGASFAWRAVPTPSSGFVRGNYEMPESTSVAGLGWQELTPGEQYDLEIETQGQRVLGSTMMPERPVLRLRRGVGVDTVVWNRAAGAVAYAFGDRDFSTDTLFVVPSPLPDDNTYFVTAYERNLYAYLKDTTTLRSGITGAFGLLGARVTTTITIPGTRSSSTGTLVQVSPPRHSARAPRP